MKKYVAFLSWSSLFALSWLLILHVISYDLPTGLFLVASFFGGYAASTNLPVKKE